MAKYYGTLYADGKVVTKTGHHDGMKATAQSYTGSVSSYVVERDGKAYASIYACTHSDSDPQCPVAIDIPVEDLASGRFGVSRKSDDVLGDIIERFPGFVPGSSEEVNGADLVDYINCLVEARE